MAKLKPFSALRFSNAAGKISELVCPPYDIISEAQRTALINKNPHNVIRLELPRGDNPYGEAAEVLSGWLSDETLVCDDRDSIYIYEEKFTVAGKDYSLKGFISRVRLEDFSKGVILPHEETLSKAKKDRFALMTATGCNFSQIYSLYNDPGHAVGDKIDALSSGSADISFEDGEGVVHSLWRVSDDGAIAEIVKKMADKKLYIADGHHRYETALNFSKQNAVNPDDDSEAVNYCMMMMVNMESDGLVVFPTHRVLHSIEGFDAAAMLEKCRGDFELEQLSLSELEPRLDSAAAQGKKSFAFYSGGDNFCLMTLKDSSVMRRLLPDKSDAYRNLDVSVLHSLVLERLFGIDRENMANQVNLFYTRSADEALDAVRGDADCCFIINPTRVTEIRDVAAAGEKMPQKSTYFYPKLITGLVMNKFTD